MNFADLIELPEDAIVERMLEDAHAGAPQMEAWKQAAARAVREGALSGTRLTRWIAACRRVGDTLIREAKALEIYDRACGARIRGVIDGGRQ